MASVYYKRKELGVCVRCGKEKERKDIVMCNACHEKVSREVEERKKKYLELGLCPKCGTEYLVGDEKMCFNCREKRNKKNLERRNNNLERYRKSSNEATKRMHERRKAAGLCIKCGKIKVYGDSSHCEKCKAINREYYRKDPDKVYDRHLRAELGLCTMCGDKVYQNHKLCKRCYDAVSKNAVKGRAKWKETRDINGYEWSCFGYEQSGKKKAN